MQRWRTFPFLLAPFLVGCQAQLFTITISESSEVVVGQGTLLEDVVGDLGFDFTDMNLVDNTELQNQGVAPGDIRTAIMTSLELEALSPNDADLSWMSEMKLSVSGPDLDEVLLASQDTFPEGQALVSFDVEEIDLTAYIVSEKMTLTTDVTGMRPPEDTTVEARFSLKVGVTGQGVANAAKQ